MKVYVIQTGDTETELEIFGVFTDQTEAFAIQRALEKFSRLTECELDQLPPVEESTADV